MADHYHFYACKELGIGFVMSRRFPCGCESCRATLALPWDYSIKDPTKQPRFQRPKDCRLKDAVEDLNDWKLIHIAKPNGNSSYKYDEMEVRDLNHDMLAEIENQSARLVNQEILERWRLNRRSQGMRNTTLSGSRVKHVHLQRIREEWREWRMGHCQRAPSLPRENIGIR